MSYYYILLTMCCCQHFYQFLSKCPERTPAKPALFMAVKSEEDPHQMSKLRLQGSFVCFYNEQSEHYLYSEEGMLYQYVLVVCPDNGELRPSSTLEKL